MSDLKIIEVVAGYNADGQPIVERLQTTEQKEGEYRVITTPAFAPLAKLDLIKLTGEAGEFEIVEHSGNLNVRIVSRANIESIIESLRAPIEKLGGEIENETERLFSLSCHVSVGFGELEAILNETLAKHEQSGWAYTNVFDPQSGEPLNWWQDVLKEH